MDKDLSQPNSEKRSIWRPVRSLYGLLAPRAYTAIMFGALFCTLAAKLFRACRSNLLGEYPDWILTDIALLLLLELLLAMACFRLPRRRVIRTATIIAAVVCTWSVMNASWIIRFGVQMLPSTLLPLIRDPINCASMIGVNLAKMPVAAFLLLGPSAVALAFFFCALAKAPRPNYDQKSFSTKVIITLAVILAALTARGATSRRTSIPAASIGLRYNSQLRAVTSLFYRRPPPADATREIPTFDQMKISLAPGSRYANHNIVIVVFEGVQYACTSFAQEDKSLTPFLTSLARQGAKFTNVRSAMSHTTKALFSLLTGRYPSAFEDIAEAVPVPKPYASLVTILEQNLNFRSAFFQSAKGSFECRPGLVSNLGFDKFWSREDLPDEEAFVGYLGSDEYAMLDPISEWIRSDDKPFLLTILCSVTHDPHEIPERFGTPAKDQFDRYRQSITYTDSFIAALDSRLAELTPSGNTILCVVGDHGEAFGEHGLFGHERISFDETLHVPLVIRASGLVKPETTITSPVTSADLTPTILALLGFHVQPKDFEGVNVLAPTPSDRKVYFSCWMHEGPAGFVQGNHKYTYRFITEAVSVYDLAADPLELSPNTLPEQEQKGIAADILDWRRGTVFRLNRERIGEITLFSRWRCEWNSRYRIASANYQTQESANYQTQEEE